MTYAKYLKQRIEQIKRKRILLLVVILPLVVLLAYPLVADWQERRQHQALIRTLTKMTETEIIVTPVLTSEPIQTRESIASVTPVQTTASQKPDPTPASGEPTATPAETAEPALPTAAIPKTADFPRLLELNPDTIAWIEVPGTIINYPVVQTGNNTYYLDRDFLRRRARTGSIFMDYRNKGELTERHTILYGHHMRDGSMFAGLMAYKDKAFFYENDRIILDTPDGPTEWQIFSAYVTTIDFYYIVTRFPSSQAFLDFLETIADKSHFPGVMRPTAEDRLLTLSTCTYEYDNARFVVHAVRIQ